MCTSFSIRSKDGHNFFGRNLDLAYEVNESPIIIPRNYDLEDKITGNKTKVKRAIIGMGTMIDNHPSMIDAMNEDGLVCAGLNFEGFAHFEKKPVEGKTNVTPYDFIIWVLSNHENIIEVKTALKNLELVGVMTNQPTFDWHLMNLNRYLYITPNQPEPVKWSDMELKMQGVGAGTLGLPGDSHSISRFVRIAYARSHMPVLENDISAVTQCFHMLDYVKMVKSGVLTDGLEEKTTYSACMDQENGIYYYKNFGNNKINAVSMHKEDLDKDEPILFKYFTNQDINHQN